MTDATMKEIQLIENIIQLGKIYGDCDRLLFELGVTTISRDFVESGYWHDITNALHRTRRQARERIIRELRDYAADMEATNADD